MRAALIIFALISLTFIGTIIYTLAWRDGNSSFLTKETTVKVPVSADDLDLETLKYQIKLEQKVDELTKKIEQLNPEIVSSSTRLTTPVSETGSTQTGQTIIPISGKFLAQVMPTLEFTLIENNGIFDLHTFDLATPYSTYSDIKYWIVLVVTKLSYDKMLKNFKALPADVYLTNETKTFPFRSFYVNPPKSDPLVRLVLESESQAIFIQIPKTKFASLKSLLLKPETKN